jgi:hypothetical protein
MKKKYLFLFAFILLLPLHSSFGQSSYKIYNECIFDSTPGGRLIIDVNYPLIKNIQDISEQQKFNQYIEEIIKTEVNTFKGMVDTSYLPFPEMRFSFDIDYSVLYQENDFLSIVFHSYAYTGGAHGMPYVFIINYDFIAKEDVKLSDVFKGSYLEIFSNFSRTKLIENGFDDDEWLREGTSAVKSENFSAWGFNGKEIVIIFQAYQVGPYAIGMPEVSIPIEKFKGFIRSEGVLEKFAR